MQSLLLLLMLICCISGDSAANCTSGFTSSLSDEEDLDSNFTQIIDMYSGRALYLFPKLQLYCEKDIKRVRGYFLVDPDESISFHLQIWRKQKLSRQYVRFKEINLNFSAHCESNNNDPCYVDYLLPLELELEVENDDFIGFYTSNNTLARPLFSSSNTTTQLYLFRFNRGALRENFTQNLYKISYRPQVIVIVGDMDGSTSKHNTVAIIVGVSVFVSCVMIMVMGILAVTVLYKKRLKSIRKSFSASANENVNRYQRYIDPPPMNRYYYTVVNRNSERNRRSIRSNTSLLGGSYANISEESDPYEVPFNPCSTLEKIYTELYDMEVSPEDVVLGSEIGSGQFGIVSHGIWHHDKQAKQVAIKTLHGEVSEEAKKILLKEAAVIRKFAHTNIVKLYGVVTRGDPVMILFEYLSKGDLLKFLVSSRPREGENVNQPIPALLLGFARDIGRGMNYLSNKRFVHRDLAARNILLTEDCVCKIADFGMSRDLENDYYITHGGVVPVKWTAPEALLYRTYTTASDVWSYGVVLYEMWSIGRKPFGDKGNNEVMELLNNGYRLPPPPGCPRQIYNVMIQCWNPTHKMRPNFSTLLRTISQPSYVLFHWIEEDKQAAGPQCDVLGAPLECGHNLYLDLQNTYKINNTDRI